MKNKKIGLTHLILILVSFVWIYPFIWMVSASFKTQDEIFSQGLNLIPKNFNFDNFIRAWNNANFEAYFLNSIIVTVSTVLLVLILSAMMGYVMGRYEFKGKKAVLLIFLASMVIPLGFTIIPIYQAIKALGLMNTRLGLILAESGGSHIIFILLFAGFFKEIPKELEEAAIMDGCGFLRIFINIMLPLSKPIIGSVVIMQFIWTWNSFLLPLVLTLSKEGLRTLAVGLYAFKGEYVVDWTGIAAGGTISLIPIIIVFVVLQKYFVEGIAGSIKG
ncbi:carbohydrate ABC transporter permease [Vallitalea guaymasensis]|uniref:Carbohydrate ABC transporter permease n=1 Tax=Vallitalea guaymasensis TaxID=1185412 RepID=A0A8J8MFP8_9FIRM|nr:carbohydrate ABC transporter permease [Vallitalea guaymasensis]QUH31999.1 carbohydrate ABC transporter permease [Vallitalea guaymasensis]